MTKQMIGYVRCSTQEQADSRLGVEAQRTALVEYCDRQGYVLVDIVEDLGVSAKGHDLKSRPTLESLIPELKQRKQTLLVLRTDRLSRSVAFIASLMATKAPFEIAELGADIEPMMVYFHAIVAERERDLIGQRTSAALRAKGYKGQPQHLTQDGNKDRREKAAKDAEVYRELITGLQHLPRWQIAERLNDQRVATKSGAPWTRKSVGKVIGRLQSA